MLNYLMIIGGIICLILSFNTKLIDKLFSGNHSLGLHVFRIVGVILLLNGANMQFLHI